MLQTQADFVCHVTAATEQDRLEFLVMGEYNLLMETNSPKPTVCNTKNVRQVMTNAYMMESMTNMRISYGVIFYLTRRGPENRTREDEVPRSPLRLHGNPHHRRLASAGCV